MTTPTSSADNGKTAAIVSYITIIGWLVSYFAMYKDNKTSLAAYHLRQTLLLFIIAFGYQIILWFIIGFMPYSIYLILRLVGIGFFVLWIIGLIAAVNGEEKPMPLIGEKAQEILKGI